MKNIKAQHVASQVQALFYDGNTPIGQLADGREIVLTKAQVKAIMAKILA
jgi:hypothetical protein